MTDDELARKLINDFLFDLFGIANKHKMGAKDFTKALQIALKLMGEAEDKFESLKNKELKVAVDYKKGE